MRVIQMTTDTEVNEETKNPRDPDRTRDLFGIQLEVIWINQTFQRLIQTFEYYRSLVFCWRANAVSCSFCKENYAAL